MDFVIISGLSGAGKSRVASFMEDMGFFCVDNLPVPLIPKFAEMGMGASGSGEYDRVALVTDVRAGGNFDALFQALDELTAMKCPYQILFMDAADDAIIKRYKESRRSHPLEDTERSLEEAITQERELLSALRSRADHIIDTSDLPTAKLRDELHRLFRHGEETKQNLRVSVTSFGFKHGLPRSADLVFDVRFLPNPHYVSELRPLTGLEEAVRSYVFRDGQAEEFLIRLKDMLDYLLPRYAQEGKTALVVAIGCTGGHHRSVAVTHEVAEHIRRQGYAVSEDHRDIARN